MQKVQSITRAAHNGGAATRKDNACDSVSVVYPVGTGQRSQLVVANASGNNKQQKS